MALINPSTLYSGGNVKLDFTPYLRIAMQERARKDARDFAIGQYYQKLPDTINDKGTRDQEIPVINDLKNKMVEYGIKNREALINPKKDGGAAQLGMQQLFRQASTVTRESQNAAKTDLELGKMWFNKDNQSILNSEDFIKQHELHNLPVTNPNHVPLDIAKVMANRPFDQDAYVKEIKSNFKYGEGVPTITPHPTDKNLQVETTTPVLDDQTKQGIYAASAYKFHNDAAFQKQLQKNFSTPEQLSPLNEVSKKVFGHEITQPEDVAAAYTVSLLPTSAVKTKTINSIGAKNQFAIEQQQRGFSHAEKMQRLNDALIRKRKVDGVDEVEVGFPTDELNKSYGHNLSLKNSDGSITNKRVVFVKDIPTTTLETINPTDMNKQKFPVDPLVTKLPNGKYEKYYEYDEEGNLIGRLGKKIGRNDAQALYIDKYANTKVKVAHGNQGKITIPTGIQPTNNKKKILD